VAEEFRFEKVLAIALQIDGEERLCCAGDALREWRGARSSLPCRSRTVSIPAHRCRPHMLDCGELVVNS